MNGFSPDARVRNSHSNVWLVHLTIVYAVENRLKRHSLLNSWSDSSFTLKVLNFLPMISSTLSLNPQVLITGDLGATSMKVIHFSLLPVMSM